MENNLLGWLRLGWARRLRAYIIYKEERRQQEQENEEQEEEEEEDLISRLPDDILHIILSKLPIRDAAVTTAVSKRWAPLFPTLPSLKIDDASFKAMHPWIDPASFKLVYPEIRWVDPLFSVLNSRKAPVKKFEIAAKILDRYHEDFYKVFRKLCVSGVKELSIANSDFIGSEFFEPYRIPSPVFSCNTIVKLEIVNCDLVVPSKFTGLRSVKSLKLSGVTVADGDLRRMISRCKAMEKLVIILCHKVKNIVIRAPRLSELVISVCSPVEISLQSVPRLASVKASFSVSDFEKASVGTNEATKLVNFLNGLGGVKHLRLNFCEKYCMVLAKEGIALPTRLSPECYLVKLKKLCLINWAFDYHTSNTIVSCLLNSSPHLMEIIIWAKQRYYPDALVLDLWDKQLPAECVKHHLTTATFYLDDYISKDCFGFPKFLLRNATTLKNIDIFYTGVLEDKSETAEKIKNELLAVQMASPNVEMRIKPLICSFIYFLNFWFS